MNLRGCSVLLLAFLCTIAVRADRINVFAAASLANVLEEIAASFEAVTGHDVRFNLGASSTLALQIAQGAPADVFFSADETWMDELGRQGLVVGESRRSLLSNTLVIVVNAQDGAAVRSPDDLGTAVVRRLALAEPATVPAGVYARQYLERRGLWSMVERKVVPTANVQACLAAVEAGNVDAGMVYKTDALASNEVRVVYEVDGDNGPQISYPVAVLRDARNPGPAREFVDHLSTAEARRVFTRFGFRPLP